MTIIDNIAISVTKPLLLPLRSKKLCYCKFDKYIKERNEIAY